MPDKPKSLCETCLFRDFLEYTAANVKNAQVESGCIQRNGFKVSHKIVTKCRHHCPDPDPGEFPPIPIIE